MQWRKKNDDGAIGHQIAKKKINETSHFIHKLSQN